MPRDPFRDPCVSGHTPPKSNCVSKSGPSTAVRDGTMPWVVVPSPTPKWLDCRPAACAYLALPSRSGTPGSFCSSRHLQPSRCQALGGRQAVLGTTPTARTQNPPTGLPSRTRNGSDLVRSRVSNSLRLELRRPRRQSGTSAGRRAGSMGVRIAATFSSRRSATASTSAVCAS
jgi:hypothetical protein